MSLARAFTKRVKRPDISLPGPARAVSVRKPDGTFDRTQISAPVVLLSTTNVLAYEAPDIHPTSPKNLLNSSSSSSMNSYDSDGSPTFSSSTSTSDSATDISSPESSPSPVEPNHLSCYFKPATTPTRSSTSQSSHRESNASSDNDTPAIPTRAPSHTKKSHQVMARKRSLRMSPPPNVLHSAANTIRSSFDMFTSKPESNHPFGPELEQVNELAEDFAPKDPVIMDDEEQFLMSHGLRRFGAEEYVMEIQGLFGAAFQDSLPPIQEGWI